MFGHWSVRGKVDLPLVKGLDTGCVYGGELSAITWPEKKWYDGPRAPSLVRPARDGSAVVTSRYGV